MRFGVDGRAQMLMGVDKLADAVQVRLVDRWIDGWIGGLGWLGLVGDD